jgi:hypothetical protein
MGMHGEGLRRGQLQLFDLLAHIARDELDRRLHFGYYTPCFLDALQACLAESFLLGDAADGGDVVLDIAGNELPVATDASLEVDKVVRVPNGLDALPDYLALLYEPLVLVASRLYLSLGLLQTRYPYSQNIRTHLFTGGYESIITSPSTCLPPCFYA